jgi:DNA-binding transcriptional ArsR family regulator
LTGSPAAFIVNRMVNYSSSLDSTFSALADPTRRAILASLMLGEASISELAKPHRMSLPAVMKHVDVLENAGLVTQKKTGRTRHCQLAAKPLQDAEAWISQYQVFWQNTLDSLERYLSQPETQAATGQVKEDTKWQRRNRNRKKARSK